MRIQSSETEINHKQSKVDLHTAVIIGLLDLIMLRGSHLARGLQL